MYRKSYFGWSSLCCGPVSGVMLFLLSYFCIVLSLGHLIMLISGSSYFWIILFLDHLISGSSYFWIVLFLDHLISGSSYFWIILFLDHLISGSSYFWVVLFLGSLIFRWSSCLISVVFFWGGLNSVLVSFLG